MPEGSSRLDANNWKTPNGKVYRKTRRGYILNQDYKQCSGERRGQLTREDASYIKGQLAAGGNKSWLAEKFNVTVSSIHLISTGRNWRDVETPDAELEGPPKGVHRSQWAEHLPYDEEVAFEGRRSGRKSYSVARR